MAQAKTGDSVRVHYTGKFSDGEVFDSSVGRDTLQFVIGAGQLIAGFDRAVIGMQPGEAKTVTFGPEEGYGVQQENLVFVVERQTLPAQVNPEVGQRYQIRQGDGNAMAVTVTAVSAEGITLDGNHPLAGRDLTFEIQLVEIL
jgi:FKBP-type peptidyl-prolyl cis-trans isomerase 2